MNMDEPIRCHQCGALVQVPASAYCSACGAALAQTFATLEDPSLKTATPLGHVWVIDHGGEALGRLCAKCGAAATSPDATVCAHCGQALPALLQAVQDPAETAPASSATPGVPKVEFGLGDASGHITPITMAEIEASPLGPLATSVMAGAAAALKDCPGCHKRTLSLHAKPPAWWRMWRTAPVLTVVCQSCGFEKTVR
jgi:ribosomal protein L37E